MASGLRAKLNMIGASVPRTEKKPPRAGGVAIYTHRVPADAYLDAPDTDGLRRIGWMGGAFDVRKCVFLDTETTGLSSGAGTVAFLVGVGWIADGDFVVEQYLMRDYADEPEMLAQLARRLAGFDTAVTFNGRNFDLPLLRTRFTMNRMRDDWRELDQLDLLYPARRTWKRRIGSCRLACVEEQILGTPRGDDLPGSEVPQRYFEYLKTGETALLDDIVRHNRQDIVTLMTLLSHLIRLYAAPERETRRQDLLSMGRALERQGELKPARELYRIASIPAPAGSLASFRGNAVAEEAAWRLYLLARRNRDADAMREILEQMANRRQCRDRIYVELAKLYEHRMKNPRRALRYAELAAKYVSPKALPELEARRARLQKKIEQETGGGKNGLF